VDKGLYYNERIGQHVTRAGHKYQGEIYVHGGEIFQPVSAAPANIAFEMEDMLPGTENQLAIRDGHTNHQECLLYWVLEKGPAKLRNKPQRPTGCQSSVLRVWLKVWLYAAIRSHRFHTLR
jgi:hypothetical protein